MNMQNRLIDYYANVSDMAIENLKQEKKFQFRKHLTNHSLLKVVESNYEKITRSDEAKKLIKEYMESMNNMYKPARDEYNKTLALLKATKDPMLKQKIIDEYCERGIHGFTAKNGAHWNIETYSNMATTHFNNELVRLSVLETRIPGDKFEVSSHAKACPLCVPFEGKILTYEELQEAKAAGLFHVRCKHLVTKV
jgi:tetratricopeptide (TPR) repeat protein